MSRIRSVHPGLWTDERFVSVSPLARLLIIGIWNECDDAGSFEWSPLKLKMRILPADNADVSALLEELTAANLIIPYDIDGRKLGAVRNFTRYQRPKKPNSIYPQTDQVRNYCSGNAQSVPNRFPTSGGIAPQMEEGGGRREDSDEPDGSPAADGGDADHLPDGDRELDFSPPQPVEPIDPLKVMFDSGIRLFADEGKPPARARALLGKWRQRYGTEAVIIALGKAQREGAIDLTSFMEGCLRNGSGTRDFSSGSAYTRSGSRSDEMDAAYGDLVSGRQ